MEIITKEKIAEYQKSLTDKVRKELIEKNVKVVYEHFLHYIMSFYMKNKNLKRILAKENFENQSRQFVFNRHEIMLEVQKNLQDLFPDCHIAYQLNDSDGVEITMSWD